MNDSSVGTLGQAALISSIGDNPETKGNNHFSLGQVESPDEQSIRLENDRILSYLLKPDLVNDRTKAILNKKKFITLNRFRYLINLNEMRLSINNKLQEINRKQNEINEGLHGKPDAETLRVVEKLKQDERRLVDEIKKLHFEMKDSWNIPNTFSDDTPIGKDESENKVIKVHGEPRRFDFKPKDHVELGRYLKIIDIETAAKVAGTRFNYLEGDAVLLQNALYQFAISVLTDEKILKKIADKVEKGYSSKPFIPVIPPLFISPGVYEKMARLSKETKVERYYIKSDNQYLIGSAEHTLGPMHIDETLGEKELPLRYFAFTPAFRREAGSYGKDTRGILRQHQFDKLEMESFTVSGNGVNEQNFFVAIQEYLMQCLELPYRVVAICTGDMGGPDFRQIDIETWIPTQGKYRETHTSDYMTDYQAARLNTKVRTKDGPKFVHMNDATAFAMGRTIIAILENYQNEDGSVSVPKVLQKWMGNKEKITNQA